MSKKFRGFCVLGALCALSLFLLSCGSSSSRPSGLLYVLTQGSNGVGNNISSFSINLDSGSLSLINSNASTCNAGASACGLPIDIVLDPTGADAFVLNQGIPSANVSPTIYPYSVNSDGSLSSPGTVASWNCIGLAGGSCVSYPDISVAMARDAMGQFLFVIDQGSSPAPITCPARGVAVNSAADAANFAGCPSISVFSLQPGSNALTFVSQSSSYQSPFFISKIPTGLSPVVYTPSNSTTAQEVLFTSNNLDICTNGCSPLHNDNTLGVYSVSSSGILTEQIGSPYATETDPISVQAVNTNPTTGGNNGGVFIYVGVQPTSAGALNAFQVCTVQNATCTAADVASSTLTPVGTPTSAGQLPVSMLVDPTNNFLYVAAQGTNQVFGFNINTTSGVLSPLSPASQPTGSLPVALAMHAGINSAGQFLYVSNSASSNISGFNVSTTTGSMSSPTTVISPSGPSGMAAK
jgi:Lactonase, 7-bladed beta-propeller